ncbi:MAG: rhomboid family intramembrane serine protease [bacterium]|nr:rhomboid family intramembrane serine protease [bacterium]
MDENPAPDWKDKAVGLLAGAMDAVGLNGRRLLWKWGQRKRMMGEAGMRAEQMLRSTQTPHKMCPECRALVPRSASKCPECESDLSRASTPGVGRLASNLLPGMRSAVSLILLVNGFWFLLMVLAQRKFGGGFSFHPELLVRFGSGLSRPAMLSNGAITGGEWWRLVTPIFLHGGLFHFFMNSLVLLRLGAIGEDLFGTQKFWVLYLSCGLTGSLVSQLPRSVNTVGASGAIFGLVGLLLCYAWRVGGRVGQTLRGAMMQYVVFMVILTALTWGKLAIDHRNHIGGFVCGAVLGWIVPGGEPQGKAERNAWQFAALAGVLLVLAAFAKTALFGAANP